MLTQSDNVLIQVMVPKTHQDVVRQALGDAGAGKQGNYSHCSATIDITGRFMPLAGAQPAIGSVGKAEVVEEVLIQTMCHQDILTDVIMAVKAVHPYEEPAIYVIPMVDVMNNKPLPSRREG